MKFFSDYLSCLRKNKQTGAYFSKSCVDFITYVKFCVLNKKVTKFTEK